MLWRWVCLFLIIICTYGCKSKEEASDNDVPASWPESMREMAKELNEIIPYIYSSKAFFDIDNRSKISAQLQSFAKAVHKVPEDKAQMIFGKDPIIKYSLRYLEDDVNTAVKSFNSGHTPYARELIKSSIGQCFKCHTRTDMGPSIQMKLDFPKFRMEPAEKAELLIATRQYDQAEEYLSRYLTSRDMDFFDHPFEQEKAFKRYLALVVRVKKDPTKALSTAQSYLARVNLPVYMRENATQWKQSLKDWIKEPAEPQDFKGREELVKKLLKKGKKISEEHNTEAAQIEFLRATAVLHDMIKYADSAKSRAELYYQLGNSYDVLNDIGFWNLPDLYYEACIREYPKSKLAQQCFVLFERNIIWGFSGTAGTFLPKREQERLHDLKVLSGLVGE